MVSRKKVRLIVEDNTTRSGKTFDFFIQGIILLSLITFSLETIPSFYSEYKMEFDVIEKVVVAIFTIEYILRVYVANKPLKYIFSFYGIIDLISTLPFYLGLSFDLRFIRVFRVLRVFRALKLVKYNKAMRHFQVAFSLVKEELILFMLVTLIFVFISSCGIYFFENEAQPNVFRSVPHCFWWSITTLTTVGYGDAIPITYGGRIFTFIILMFGIGVITIPAGLMASSLSKARELIEDDKDNGKHKK